MSLQRLSSSWPPMAHTTHSVHHECFIMEYKAFNSLTCLSVDDLHNLLSHLRADMETNSTTGLCEHFSHARVLIKAIVDHVDKEECIESRRTDNVFSAYAHDEFPIMTLNLQPNGRYMPLGSLDYPKLMVQVLNAQRFNCIGHYADNSVTNTHVRMHADIVNTNVSPDTGGLLIQHLFYAAALLDVEVPRPERRTHNIHLCSMCSGTFSSRDGSPCTVLANDQNYALLFARYLLEKDVNFDCALAVINDRYSEEAITPDFIIRDEYGQSDGASNVNTQRGTSRIMYKIQHWLNRD